jgi:hypothetical protein
MRGANAKQMINVQRALNKMYKSFDAKGKVAL